MGALAALSDRSGLGPGPAFRRFLAPAGLLGRLGLRGAGRCLSRRCARLARFCGLGSGCGLILLLRSHEFDCSFGGSYRSHDIHGSDWAAHQAKSEPYTRAPGETAEGMAIPVSPSGEVTWCAMANKVTVFPRPSQTKEPTEMTIFALGDQRVVIDLRDGTSRFQTTAEVISIEQKRKPRRRSIRTTPRTH